MRRPPVRIGGMVLLVGSLALPAAWAAARPVQHQNTVIDLWAAGEATFGVFVPNERPRAPRGEGRGQRRPALYSVEGGVRLAQNPLYDFVFLNLEGGYDAAAVASIVDGLRRPGAVGRKTLLVRIPSIERAGPEATRERVAEILVSGGDGVVFPHVRGPEEAALAVSFMTDAGADVWSPANPGGDKIAMIMIEDPDSLARVAETADVTGISILACGIGSLRGALGGDRNAAEAGNQEVLVQAKRAGVADMITAGTEDVERRVGEGFLALLMQGPEADQAIRIGRVAAGR